MSTMREHLKHKHPIETEAWSAKNKNVDVKLKLSENVCFELCAYQ